MRSVLLFSLALLGLAQNAYAADPAEDAPPLRGSEVYEPPAPAVYTRWSGLYGGAQAVYGSANLDFSRATQSLAAYSLRTLALEADDSVSKYQLLDTKHTGSGGFGGFAGYNVQWEDIIFGVEVSYSKNSFTAVATNSPLSRTTSAAGNTYAMNLNGAASMTINDYGQLRGRVGYAFGSFMPYVAGGFALGRVDFTRAWSISAIENPGTASAVPFSYANSEAKNGAFVGGWSIGAGLDVAVWQHVFLRGEVDYISFAPISGIQASIVTGRVGGGLKF